jgi:hypothetical protein
MLKAGHIVVAGQQSALPDVKNQSKILMMQY